MKGKHFRKKETQKKFSDDEVGDYLDYFYKRLFCLTLFSLLAAILLIWCYIEVSSPWLS